MLSHEYAIVELDIVESLRNHAKDRDIDAWMNCKDAADEIERLREALSAMTELFKATEASAQFALSEVERLRAALERLAELDEFVCGKPQTIEEVMNYTQFVARAALEENNDG